MVDTIRGGPSIIPHGQFAGTVIIIGMDIGGMAIIEIIIHVVDIMLNLCAGDMLTLGLPIEIRDLCISGRVASARIVRYTHE